jgi:hypothetical protein
MRQFLRRCLRIPPACIALKVRASHAGLIPIVSLFFSLKLRPASSILKPAGTGGTGKDFLTKDAPQIAAIWRMVERLASGKKTANVSAAFHN